MRQVYIVCYDITNNNVRKKIDVCLSRYGSRIQYSVFEIVISEDQLKTIRQHIKHIINVNTDKLNYYRLCQWCRTSAQVQGKAVMSDIQGHICV